MDTQQNQSPSKRILLSNPMLSILNTLVRSGVLGAVLAWMLVQNQRLTEKMFEVIENNTRALTHFSDGHPSPLPKTPTEALSWQP